jgi:hypothetical protein
MRLAVFALTTGSLLAAAALAGADAEAAVLTTIASGTVVDGTTDGFGLFGPVGANLLNAPFTMKISINLDGAPLTVSPGQQIVAGGSSQGLPSIGRGRVTINGHTRRSGGAYDSYAALYACSGLGTACTEQFAEDFKGNIQSQLEMLQGQFLTDPPTSLTTIYPNACLDTRVCRGMVFWRSAKTGKETVLSLQYSSLQESLSGAPEPEEWALLLGGMAGLGVVARRARRGKPGLPG